MFGSVRAAIIGASHCAADLGEDLGRVGLRRLPGRLLEAALRAAAPSARATIRRTASWPKRIASSIVVLGDFAGARLDHDDGVVGAGDDEVDVRLVALRVGRVQDELAVERARRARRRSGE